MKTFERLGESAYQAYCKHCSAEATNSQWVPEHRPWQLLGAFEKAAWTAAAKQVAAEIAALH